MFIYWAETPLLYNLTVWDIIATLPTFVSLFFITLDLILNLLIIYSIYNLNLLKKNLISIKNWILWNELLCYQVVLIECMCFHFKYVSWY